jgi:hypothetical protein
MHREGPRGEVQSFLGALKKRPTVCLVFIKRWWWINKKKNQEEKLTLPYKKVPLARACVCAFLAITSPRCLCRSRVGDFYLCVSPPQGVISHPAHRHFSFLHTKVTLLRDDFQWAKRVSLSWCRGHKMKSTLWLRFLFAFWASGRCCDAARNKPSRHSEWTNAIVISSLLWFIHHKGSRRGIYRKSYFCKLMWEISKMYTASSRCFV